MCSNSGNKITADLTPAAFVPSVARWVHYWHRGSADGAYPPTCSAALITGVSDADGGVISATVFTAEGGIHPHRRLERDESATAERRGGTWHVPEFVPPPGLPPGIPSAGVRLCAGDAEDAGASRA